MKHHLLNDDNDDAGNNDTTDHQCYNVEMNDYHHREVEKIKENVIVEEEVEVGGNNNNIRNSSNHVKMINSNNKKRRVIQNYDDDDDSISRHEDDGWTTDDGDDNIVINVCDDDDAGRYEATDDDNNIMNAISDDKVINRCACDDENDDNNDNIDLSINNNTQSNNDFHRRRRCQNYRIQQQFDKIINAARGIVEIDDDDSNSHCDNRNHSRSIHQRSKVHAVVTPNTTSTTTATAPAEKRQSINKDYNRQTIRDVCNDHDEEEDVQYKNDSQQSQMGNIRDDNDTFDAIDEGEFEFEFIDDDMPMIQENLTSIIEKDATISDQEGCDCTNTMVTDSDHMNKVEFSSRLENFFDHSQGNFLAEKVNSDKLVNNSSLENSHMQTSLGLLNDEMFLEQAASDLVDVNGIKFFADHSLIVSSFDITCKPSLMALESNLHSSIKNKGNVIVAASLSSSCHRLHQQSTVAGCIITVEVSMKNSNHTQINNDNIDKCASTLNEQNATHNDSNPNVSRCFGGITNTVVLLTPLDDVINPDSDDIWTNVSKPVLQHLSSPEGSLLLSTIWDREFPLATNDNYHPSSLPPEWNGLFGDWTDRVVFDTKHDIEKSTSSLLQKSSTSIMLGENDVHWWTNDTDSMMMYHRQHEEQEKMAHRQKNFVVDEKEMTSHVDDNISVSTNDTSNTVTVEDRFTCEKDKDFKLLLDSHLSRMPSPRYLTKLRRILLPMIMQVVIVKESDRKKKKKKNSHANIKSKYSRCANNDGLNLKAAEDFDLSRAYVNAGRRVRKTEDRVCVGLYPLKKSLADFWLGCRETRDEILPILLKLSTKIPYYDEGMIEDPFMKYRATYFSTQSRYQYQEIQNLILDVLRKADLKYRYCGIELQLNDKLRYGDIPKDASQQKIFDDYQTFFLKYQNDEDNRFEMKRQDMIARYYNVEDENVPKEKLLQGYVLRTEEGDGMTEEQFLKETYSMNRLNESFPRHFIPLVSRPRFAQIPQSNDIDIQLRRLHFSLFNVDGSLKESVFTDVSKSDKHYFITFSNSNGAGEDDHRWQIPFLCHTKKAKCKTREVIETIVAKMNLMNPEKEHLHDLGILIGGTVDQSLHHDISRQWTIWEHHRNERKRSTTTKRNQNKSDDDNEQQLDESATVGWESNRLVYNAAMADPFAPSSFLIGLKMSNKSADKNSTAIPSAASSQNSSRSIYIGVQKDQIDRISHDKCRIKDGMPYEEYNIVRESDDVVVLEVDGGCYFTGDFQHAGVRNVVDGTDDAKLMDRLFRNIQRIVKKYDATVYLKQSQDKVGKLRSNEVLRLFSNFPGLNRLCRLHFSTKLNNSKMIVPTNAIGFHNCVANGQ